VTTLLPLLMEPNHTGHAAEQLWRIAGVVDGDGKRRGAPYAKKWIGHRIPMAFGPGDSERARDCNDWLTWGEAEGYGEAVATAKLGDAPESLWKDP
jgi:hypothetical protein